VTTIMQTSPIMLLPVDRFVFKKHITAGALVATVLAICGAMLLFIA
jgi:drug/metabolite transporter (DMT)-like permease